jgi:predicted ArsR family transcriptional regulator
VSKGERSRGNLIGKMQTMTAWLKKRRSEFKTCDFAEEFHISTRSALRWLESLEASGLVECNRSGKPWIWRPV